MNKRLLFVWGSIFGVLLVAGGLYWLFANGAELHLYGTVEIQEVRLGSKVGGRVAKVLVAEGEEVKVGQELVIFEAPELEAQKEQQIARIRVLEVERDKLVNGPRREEIRAAQAAAKSAEARFIKMTKGFREEEKLQAQGDWESAEAELRQAERDLKRTYLALQKKSVAPEEYDAALAARDRARGRVLTTKARLDLVEKGYRKEEKDEAEADWMQAQAKAQELVIATQLEIRIAYDRISEAQGKLQEIQTNLKEAVVLAPDKAIVEVVAVRKGDLVPPNQPIVRILRAEDLWIKVFVPETKLGRVELNKKVQVRIDSFPGTDFEGVIRQIASISEFTPRNIQTIDERRHQVFAVKVVVNNSKGIFKSGMAAKVIVPLLVRP